MSKTISFKEKYKKTSENRRLTEILKAQAHTVDRNVSSGISETANIHSTVKKMSYQLNLGSIKTDLIKTALYVVFVVACLVLLKRYNLEFDFGIYK